MKILTTKLNRYGGFATVLAKLYDGSPCPVTYANRTQAYKKEAELKANGIKCAVIGTQPFYIKIIESVTPNRVFLALED